MTDYATRAELQAVEHRLNRDIRDTERLLRQEFIASMDKMGQQITGRVDVIDEHLYQQDRAWRKFFGSVAGTVLAFALLHYGLHVG